jgi:maleate isomerase
MMDATAGLVRLGMLTPSSNTVLEPATAALLADVPQVTAHFARLRVLSIGLGAGQRAQFDPAPMVAAAELLADAKVASLTWNGTSGAWLGIEADRAIVAAITAATGIPTTTCTLAMLDALATLGATRIGLVTPYVSEVQAAIVSRFADAGVEVAAERHLEDPGNFSFARHSEGRVGAMMAEVAAARPQAIVVHCTNFRGLAPGRALEAETGIPVLDSVALALWGGMRAAGASTAALARHGRLFSL